MTRGIILAFTLWLGGAVTNYFFTGIGWLAILAGIVIFLIDQKDGFQKKDVARAAPIVLFGIAFLLIPAIVKPLRVEREERRLAVEILNDEKEVLNREGYRKTMLIADSLYCESVDATVDSVENWFQSGVYGVMETSTLSDSTGRTKLQKLMNERDAWSRKINNMVAERPSAPWTSGVLGFIRGGRGVSETLIAGIKYAISPLDSNHVDSFVEGLRTKKRPTPEQFSQTYDVVIAKLGFDDPPLCEETDTSSVVALDPQVVTYVTRLVPVGAIAMIGTIIAIRFNNRRGRSGLSTEKKGVSES